MNRGGILWSREEDGAKKSSERNFGICGSASMTRERNDKLDQRNRNMKTLICRKKTIRDKQKKEENF